MKIQKVRYTLRTKTEKLEIDFEVEHNTSLAFIKYKISEILGLQSENFLSKTATETKPC